MTAGRARPAALALTIGLLAILAVLPLRASPATGLTQGALLARAYDLIYDADFAGGEAALKQACPPAPAQACEVLGVAASWWRIYFDLDNRSLDAAFKTRVNAVIDRGEAWVAREPGRAEAWFYLGAAYGFRVQYHGHRREVLAAARDGKRIKVSLEKAIALDPGLHDAYFGVGLYQYYADIAPTVLKFVRWLLALPGGDKVAGLQQMRQTRHQGVLLKAEAAYQLHLIDLWYEHQPEEAIALLDELAARYPHNPLFVLNAAQAHETYRNDRPAALAAYLALTEGARRGTLREPVLADGWGRLGAAAQLTALSEADRAIDEARVVIERRPAAPYGAVAIAHLETARALDALGRRDEAVAAYRAARAAAPADDPRQIRRDADSGLSRPPDRVTAEAARLSLEGWRALERGSLSAAAPALERAVQLRPDEGVHRYRRGRLWLARQDGARAQADFERALQVRPLPAPAFVAASLLELGRLAERAGDRPRAISHYTSALKVRGADAPTRAAATQALAALR